MFRLIPAMIPAMIAAALLAAATPAAADPAADRQAKLDILYERLATAGDADWERIQNQIYALWLESGSDTSDLLMARARAAIDAEDYATALIHLDDLVRLAPDFAEAWNMRATVHFLRDDYGSAVWDIWRTLALEPRHFGAMAGLGMILDRIGEKRWALRVYRRVLEIHPHLEGAAEGAATLVPEVEGRGI